VKPANVLVRKDATGWEVKLIDFGLALTKRVLHNASTMQRSRTMLGSNIAGTLDYAAPEQLGRLPGVGVGPQADIYAFARTCCYAAFGTPNPTFEHWRQLPEEVAQLLSECLADNPKRRPASFPAVNARLQAPAGKEVAVVDRRLSEKVEEQGAEVPWFLEERGLPQRAPQTPMPCKARPALPERSVDQSYHDYLVREVSFWTNTDSLSIEGPVPQHPEALIAECRRLFCQDGFSALGRRGFSKKGVLAKVFGLSMFDPFADQLRARYQTCLLALERWAYFYPEYRGDFINLWNQIASVFNVSLVDPGHFESAEVRAKYQPGD